MSEEVAQAIADMETVAQLRAALDVALAELEAARALGEWANDRRYWTCGICPACGFGSKLDGSEFHGTGCTIAAYNAATKERPPIPDWFWL